MGVGEVTAPVVVVFDSNHFEVGVVNGKSTTSSINVLSLELLFCCLERMKREEWVRGREKGQGKNGVGMVWEKAGKEGKRGSTTKNTNRLSLNGSQDLVKFNQSLEGS